MATKKDAKKKAQTAKKPRQKRSPSPLARVRRAIRAGVPKTSRAPAPGSAQGAHLKNMVRFREMDIDADLAGGSKTPRRGNFADDADGHG
jgi:hypothetical protein